MQKFETLVPQTNLLRERMSATYAFLYYAKPNCGVECKARWDGERGLPDLCLCEQRPCVSMLFLAHNIKGEAKEAACCVKSGVFVVLSVNISVSGYQLDVKGLVAREMKLMVDSYTYTLVGCKKGWLGWYSTENIPTHHTHSIFIALILSMYTILKSQTFPSQSKRY